MQRVPERGQSMSITAVNPATGEVLRSYPEMEMEEVFEAAERAHGAFQLWRRICCRGECDGGCKHLFAQRLLYVVKEFFRSCEPCTFDPWTTPACYPPSIYQVHMRLH